MQSCALGEAEHMACANGIGGVPEGGVPITSPRRFSSRGGSDMGVQDWFWGKRVGSHQTSRRDSVSEESLSGWHGPRLQGDWREEFNVTKIQHSNITSVLLHLLWSINNEKPASRYLPWLFGDERLLCHNC
jgi:hypothetical protein